jgi:hypothetical protein
MKKFLYLFTFCFLLSAFCLNAQQKEIPDGSFENWIYKTSAPNGPYWEFENDYMYTLNSLHTLEKESDFTAFRDGSNTQHGQYCIKLVSGRVPVGITYVFLPGMVGSISQGFVNEFIGSNGEVNLTRLWEYDTPHAMEGYYKYSPKNGDSAIIDIGFYDYDHEVFSVKKMIYNTVEKWEKFSIDIPEQYWGEQYYMIRLLFVASAGVNWEHLDESVGQLGSTLWVDNVSLNYTKKPDGIKQNLFSSLKANAFPNPAIDLLNVELNEEFNGQVVIYNLQGSMILEETINGTQCQLNTSALAAGNYIFRMMNDNTIFAQGKFVVTK